MVILIENYELIQEGGTFNLVWKKESESFEFYIDEDGVKKRRPVEKGSIREVVLGYNMSIQTCLRKIIYNEITNKELKISLLEWLKLYKEENDKFTKLFKNFNLI